MSRALPSIGIDIEDLDRWRGKLPDLEPDGPSHRLFTEAEHEYCRRFPDPAPHYAGRWCAKEAVVKAVAPVARIDVRGVEIFTTTSGRPTVRLRQPEHSWLSDRLSLTISHSRTAAVAAAVLLLMPDEMP